MFFLNKYNEYKKQKEKQCCRKVTEQELDRLNHKIVSIYTLILLSTLVMVNVINVRAMINNNLTLTPTRVCLFTNSKCVQMFCFIAFLTWCWSVIVTFPGHTQSESFKKKYVRLLGFILKEPRKMADILLILKYKIRLGQQNHGSQRCFPL